jgi:hypothetical protein
VPDLVELREQIVEAEPARLAVTIVAFASAGTPPKPRAPTFPFVRLQWLDFANQDTSINYATKHSNFSDSIATCG